MGRVGGGGVGADEHGFQGDAPGGVHHQTGVAVPPAQGVGGEGQKDVSVLHGSHGTAVDDVPVFIHHMIFPGGGAKGTAVGGGFGEKSGLGVQDLLLSGLTQGAEFIHAGFSQSGLEEEGLVVIL